MEPGASLSTEENVSPTGEKATEGTQTPTENPEEEAASSDYEFAERDIIQPIENRDGLNYYMSECGLFTFGISEELDICETDDLDIAFTNGDDSIIGMFTFSGWHNTLQGISEDIIADYEESYDNVAYDESTVNGVPCFNITADTTANDSNDTELKVRFSALQYGNGDIIYIVYIGAAEFQPQLEEYYQQMINSIEYLGEPLKTEDETFSNEYYTVTVSPMWYVEGNERTGIITIGLNLQDSYDDILYRISLAPPDDEKTAKDAAESANESKNERDSTLSSEIDETEICGYDAFRVTSHTKIGDSDFFLESFYFDKDGKCWQISFTYPNGREEEFKNNIQPILESLEIK